MTVDDFAKHLKWKTDPKTIKALEKMKMKERANAIAQDAINKIKALDNNKDE